MYAFTNKKKNRTQWNFDGEKIVFRGFKIIIFYLVQKRIHQDNRFFVLLERKTVSFCSDPCYLESSCAFFSNYY